MSFICIGGPHHGQTLGSDDHAIMTVICRRYVPFGQRKPDEDGSIACEVFAGTRPDPNIIVERHTYRRERLRHSDMTLTTIYVWEGIAVTRGDKHEGEEENSIQD